MVVKIQYPTSLRRGDTRFFVDGICVGAFSGRIGIEFRIPHVRILGRTAESPNLVEIRGTKNEQSVCLLYEAYTDASMPSRKEIGIVVWQYQVRWLAVTLLSFVALGMLYPAISTLWEASRMTVAIGMGKVTLVSLPVAFLLGLLLSARRIVEIGKGLVVSGISVRKPLGAFEGIGSLTIRDGEPEVDDDQLRFDCELRRSWIGRGRR